MKKIGLIAAGAAVLGFAGAADAADLAARPYTKAPAPMVAAVYDWSGFYVGLNGGGGWGHKCWTNTSTPGGPTIPNVAEGCHDASGGLVGGQVGYRWQSASWVFGVEAQGDWANFTGSNASLAAATFGFPVTNRTKIDAFGLFTGQVGYAWNNVLWYAKAGAAVSHDKYNGLFPATGIAFDQANETRWGGVVGTGLEFGIAPNWSVAVEYDHMFMGTRNLTFTALPGAGIPVGALSRVDSIRQDVDMATIRLNYRWGGPVIAKY